MGYAEILRDVLAPWGQRVAAKLVPKIVHERREPGPCETPNVSGGVAGPCRAQAHLRCSACRKRMCLGHAFVSHMGHSVCWVCVADVVKMKGGHHYIPPEAGPQRRPIPNADELDAFKVLDLTPDATFEEVKSACKKIRAENHPDHGKTPKSRQRREEMCKAVGSAYDTLCKRLYRRESS